MRHMEIERKFLVKDLPPSLGLNRFSKICQGYISVGLDGTEVRLRRKDTKCFLTIKKGSELVRDETEIEITSSQFAQLWPRTEGKRVEKIRYEIPYGQYTIELDVYQDSLEGLVVAEVEFDSVGSSQSFVPPSWLGSEVTQERVYKNQMLALYGLPNNSRGRVYER